MKLATLQEAIADYEKITGETVDLDYYTDRQAGFLFNPTTNKYLKVLPSNEWCIFAIAEREGLSYLHLDQCYGRMRNLAPFLLEIMRIANLKIITTTTQRKPEVHCRKWKMNRISEFDYDFENRHYFFLIGDINGLKESIKWEV
jgi:hypothetical protein